MTDVGLYSHHTNTFLTILYILFTPTTPDSPVDCFLAFTLFGTALALRVEKITEKVKGACVVGIVTNTSGCSRAFVRNALAHASIHMFVANFRLSIVPTPPSFVATCSYIFFYHSGAAPSKISLTFQTGKPTASDTKLVPPSLRQGAFIPHFKYFYKNHR